MPTLTPSIHYAISVASTVGHLFNLKLKISQPNKNGQRLSLPAWIPGSYMVRDFAKNIVSIKAMDENGSHIALHKLDKQTWQADTVDGPLTIHYQVYAFDLSVRGAYINDEIAFFNGTNVFLAVEGQTTQSCALSITKPQQTELSHWKVATTMPSVSCQTNVFGDYQANNYNELIDHPVLIGEFDVLPFSAGEVNFELILAGGHQADTQRMVKDLTTICDHHIKFFGHPAPIERYQFITLLTDNAFGGLEHVSSTALMYSRNDLPSMADDSTMSDGYRVFLSLCSHEFFHTWHVKRIKPKELFDATLDSEKYTEQLWIYEGFTSYYDDLSLLRCGLLDPQQYLKIAAQNITRLIRNQGRLKQSITESSFYAWTKFYKQDEGSINHIVSYYNKGAVLAMCLDLLIRLESQHRHSLDKVMHYLWSQHGKPNIPTDIDTVQKIIKSELHLDLEDYFQRALYSTEELPYAELLAKFGIELLQFNRESLEDKGGEAPKTPLKIDFGAQIKACEIGIEVTQVSQGSSAYQAGLQAGDRAIALGQWQLSKDNVKSLLNNLKLGQKQTITILRDKKLKQLDWTALPAQADTVVLQITEQDKAHRWLLV